MINKRGEISTVVVLGTLFIIVIGVFLANISGQKNITNTRATEGACRNNPVPPLSGYVWVANCSSTWSINSDCPQNINDPSNVDKRTSNWCYQFIEPGGPVNRCLQLQKIGSANPTSTLVPNTPTQAANITQATSTPVPSSTLPPTPTPTTRSISDLARGNVTPIPTSTPISISDRTRGNITPSPTAISISDKTPGNTAPIPTPISISDITRGNVINSKIIKIDGDIDGKACTGNPDADYGCIDVYGFYLN